MATTTFIYRQSSRIGNYPGSLVLRITHKRKVKQITTTYKIYPNEWNSQKKALIIPLKESLRCTYLLQIEKEMINDLFLLKQIIETLEKQGEYNLTDILRGYFLFKKRGMFNAFVIRLTKDLTAMGQERTARAYNTTAKRFIRFYKSKDIHLEKITGRLIKAFENYLIEQGKAPNTISFYMRNLRSIYNKAVNERYIDKNQENLFRYVYTGTHITRKRALDSNSLNNICLIEPKEDNNSSKKLFESKQLFIFCFYARGMSFIDMAYLKKDNIKDNVVSYYRKKTGKIIEIKVTDEMKAIIDYFSPQAINSPYVFPIIKNIEKSSRIQYESALRLQNYRLKQLAKMADLSEPLSTHVARHSWATIAKYMNLPIRIISEGLGHSDEKTTYTYLASLERSVLDQANDQIHGTINSRSDY